MEKFTRDHLSLPDPVQWLGRLIDVNSRSSFPEDEKAYIGNMLELMRKTLADKHRAVECHKCCDQGDN